MPPRIALFEKVSFGEFKKAMEKMTTDIPEEDIRRFYEAIKLPKRATKGSAGYDFYAPFSFKITNESAVIPTGIRCKIEDGWYLGCYPRSGLGFKCRTMLDNTVGIIDADYYNSSNEGHIMLKLHTDYEDKEVEVNAGDAFAQGILVPFGVTYDDEVTEVRDGGFGSTNKK